MNRSATEARFFEIKKGPGLQVLLKVFVLIALNIFTFQSIFSVPFIWDDWTYIIHNSLLDGSEAWRRIWFSFALPDYWPLSYTILKFCKEQFGTDVFGYHAVSLTLHILNQILLWQVLKKLKVPMAYWISLLFGLHPIQVEAVAWIFQIKTLLSVFFFLVAFLLALSARPRLRALSLPAFAASLLSKPTLILFPLSWIQGMISLVLGSLNLWRYRDPGPVPASEQVFANPLWERLLALPELLMRYVEKFIWPSTLSFVDPPLKMIERLQASSTETMPLIFSCVALLILASLAVNLLREIRAPHPRISRLALLGFFLSLLPVSGIFEVYFLRYAPSSDHWAYAALAFFLVWIFGSAGGWTVSKIFLTPLLVGITFLLVHLTQDRLKVFQSEEILYLDSVQKNPKAWLAFNNLGLLKKRQGAWDEALSYYDKAISIKPTAMSYYNKGIIFEIQSKLPEAELAYRRALELHPFAPQSWNNLGVVLAKLGRSEEAKESFEQALRLAPSHFEAEHNLKNLLLK